MPDAKLITFDEAVELIELEQPDRYSHRLFVFFEQRHDRSEVYATSVRCRGMGIQ